MLDFDLAELYEVSTKVLNQAIRRNIDRMPDDFMFRLTNDEWSILIQDGMRSQIVTASQKKRNIGITPYAFTEHGVTMLASILRSEKAVKMNIAIIRAFIALRKFAAQYSELLDMMKDLQQKTGEHDEQLSQIFSAIESLLDKKLDQKSWNELGINT